MTQQVAELYTALRKAGVDDDTAARAAKSVIAIEDKETLATKADITDLRAALAELKADLTWRLFLALGLLTTIYTAINTLLLRGRP